MFFAFFADDFSSDIALQGIRAVKLPNQANCVQNIMRIAGPGRRGLTNNEEPVLCRSGLSSSIFSFFVAIRTSLLMIFFWQLSNVQLFHITDIQADKLVKEDIVYMLHNIISGAVPKTLSMSSSCFYFIDSLWSD